ncbi:MAG: hypothetical protein ABS36_03525 [Acidobacteria bacterium SCN 69-37]|nr:MAG: hypothetical protein ABS36_03525 [Acidobacteria bacterium SCN 69-37]
MKKTLSGDFDDAIDRVTAALKTEGFGVLTEIDVQRTLEQKLGVSFRRYRILGACNPPFAHQALGSDLMAGLMMPCNVIVYQEDDGTVTVIAGDPVSVAGATGNAQLGALAGTIRAKLERVMAALA